MTEHTLRKKIGNYRILHIIGRGAHTTIYIAQHLIFPWEPVVAIKLLHAHLHSKEEHHLLLQEAQILRTLKHPHILPLLDAGITEGLPYLVVTYAPRQSLRARLHQLDQRPLPLEEALALLSQVGQALWHAHTRGVVHRDLKPENILFDAKGNALLADFGIAAILEKTQKMEAWGTPLYMAPEQFLGEVSKKSDQYALGCIAYELLTGQKPFIAENAPAMGYKHVHESPAPPSQLNPRISRCVEQVILKAMAKRREDRYSDILAFVTALRVAAREQWLQEGNVHYLEKRYSQALAAYEQAIYNAPTFAHAYNNKGNVLFADSGKCEEALAAYEQAICLDPMLARAYRNKGDVFFFLQRYEEALAAYEQAIRRDRTLVGAHYGKCLTLLMLNRSEGLSNAYEQVVRLDPTAPSSGKINLFSAQREYERELVASEQMVCLDPDSAEAFYEKGNLFAEIELYEEALAAYEQATRLNPNFVHAHYRKIELLHRLWCKK